MNTIQITDLSVNELRAIISETLKEGLKEQLPSPEPPQPRYLTRKEAAKLLQISLVTLHNWSIKGILKGYRINSRIRYKSEDIQAALKEIHSLKYRRD
ncbi:MAG: helix-turn-helix domain-containing protein [Bacteroidetes bacterium]|nr:helix-turn-helix domain-containing protein [Bacteroidota bacterium]